MARAKKAEEIVKKGFTGLANLLGRGPARPATTVANQGDQLTLFPGSEMFPTATTAATSAGRFGNAGVAYQRSKAAQAAKQAAREAAGKLPIPARILGTAAARPGRTAAVGGLLGLGAYSTFGDVLGGLGQDRQDISLANIKAPTERERYLASMQGLIDQTYNVDPTLQTQRLAQATAAAERAAMAYEKMGRPDLAEGARQEVMNRYNQLSLAEQSDLASQRREALGTIQAQALELPSVRTAPSELRDLAQSYANDYYSLSQEDRDYYAGNGYATVEAYVQGKINGEI